MKKISLFIVCLLLSFSAFALKLPEGTEARVKNIQLNDNGILSAVLLSEPVEVSTSVGKVEAVGCILFYDNGNIKELTANKNCIVETPMGSLPIKGQTLLKFYESGCIEKAVLSNVTAFSIKGTIYSAKPDLICFHERWKVQEITLSKDIAVQLPCGIIPLKANTKINFSPRGALNQVVLDRPILLKTKNGTLKASGTLILHENGIAKEATADSSEMLQTMYGPIYPVPKSQLEFYSDGQIKSVVPQDVSFVNTKNHTYYIAAEKKIQYFKSGILREAYITGYTAKIYGWKVKFAEDLNRIVFYPKYKAYLPCSKIVSFKRLKALKNFELSDKNNIADRKFMLLPTEVFYWDANESFNAKVHSVDLETGSDFIIKEINAGLPCDLDENQNFSYRKPPLIFNDANDLIGYRYCLNTDSANENGTITIKEVIFPKKPVRKAETEENKTAEIKTETQSAKKVQTKTAPVPEPVVIPEPYQEDDEIIALNDSSETADEIITESDEETKSVPAAENVSENEKHFENESQILQNDENISNSDKPDEKTEIITESKSVNNEENNTVAIENTETESSAAIEKSIQDDNENTNAADFPDYLLPETSKKRNYGEGLTEEEMRAVRKFEKDVVSPDLYVEEDEEIAAELAAENEIINEEKSSDTTSTTSVANPKEAAVVQTSENSTNSAPDSADAK